MTVEAHIDIRVEGKGRSVHQPRKRLKFENILTVVPLLFLACSERVHMNGDSTKDEEKDEKEKSQYQDHL